MGPDSRRSGRSFAPPRWVYRMLWHSIEPATASAAAGSVFVPRLCLRPGGLNLQARLESIVDLPGSAVAVRARETAGSECDGPWCRSVEHLADDERYAETAGWEIPVVILELITEEAHA